MIDITVNDYEGRDRYKDDNEYEQVMLKLERSISRLINDDITPTVNWRLYDGEELYYITNITFNYDKNELQFEVEF
jgi:hypothetical protein